MNVELFDRAEVGDVKRLKEILSVGVKTYRGHVKVDPNDVDEDGFSVLMVAVAKGNLEVVELLLNHGSSVSLQTFNTKFSAFHFAAKYGHLMIMKALCQNMEKKNIPKEEAVELRSLSGQTA